MFGEESDPKIQALVAAAQPLKPNLKVKPRVYYIGLPRRFIAGAVYDSQEKECVGGAHVTLTNLQGGEKLSAQTDSYGDFWFKGLKEGDYSILVEKKGYQSHMLGPVDASKRDVNVGTINVFKKG
jgi:hypothetical protein